MHIKSCPRNLWEALLWMHPWTVCYRLVSTPQYKVGAAGELPVLPCPGVPQPMAERRGDGTGMGKSWSPYWEGCSYLEAAAWSQARSSAGLGFEVTLRSIKLMKRDKP